MGRHVQSQCVLSIRPTAAAVLVVGFALLACPSTSKAAQRDADPSAVSSASPKPTANPKRLEQYTQLASQVARTAAGTHDLQVNHNRGHARHGQNEHHIEGGSGKDTMLQHSGDHSPTTLWGYLVAYVSSMFNSLDALLDSLGSLRVAAIFFILGVLASELVSFLLQRRNPGPGPEEQEAESQGIEIAQTDRDTQQKEPVDPPAPVDTRAPDDRTSQLTIAELVSHVSPQVAALEPETMSPPAPAIDAPAPRREEPRVEQSPVRDAAQAGQPALFSSPNEALEPRAPEIHPLDADDVKLPAFDAAAASQFVRSIAAELNLRPDETRRLVDGIFMQREGPRAAMEFFRALSNFRGDSNVTGRWGFAEQQLERFLEYCFRPAPATLIAPRRNSPFEPMDVIDVTQSLTGSRSRVGKLLVPGFRVDGTTVKALIESV